MKMAQRLILSATILTALVLIGANAPSRSAPMYPSTSISTDGSDAAAVLIPIRAAVRVGSASVGPRAAARGAGAITGRRAAGRRTVVVGPRGNVVVAGEGRWARPFWYRWPVGGAIAARAAIGFAAAASASPWAGPPPVDGMCWYYTDASRSHGFWDYCPP